MIGIWILVYVLGGNNAGVTGQVEFTSQEKCQKAIKTFKQQERYYGYRTHIYLLTCVEK